MKIHSCHCKIENFQSNCQRKIYVLEKNITQFLAVTAGSNRLWPFIFLFFWPSRFGPRYQPGGLLRSEPALFNNLKFLYFKRRSPSGITQSQKTPHQSWNLFYFFIFMLFSVINVTVGSDFL